MKEKIFVFVAILLTSVSSIARAQSRVRFSRDEATGAYTVQPSYSAQQPAYGMQQPPLDPYAMPQQNGLFGAVPADPVAPQGYGAVPGQPLVTDPAFAAGPSSQFPNGLGTMQWPDGMVTQEPLRFLQGPRFRYAWLTNSGERGLQIHEFDTSVAMAFPNFFGSGTPLYILPSFSLQLWDGPKGPPQPPEADLPAQTYAAFLDMGWESDRQKIVGGELGLRLGVWSDFDTTTSDSFRILGKALLRYRITPVLSIRGGVIYADRIRVKLLPAGGILWEPNSQTRLDLYFPNPKFSKYCRTVGNQDIWWFIAGEYGGNSWTIKRAADGLTDRFDYNDIRLTLGLEWGPSELIHKGRRYGFAEIGWILDREVLYARRPQDNFRMTDTFMFRFGFGY